MYVIIYLYTFGRVAAYWEITALSAYDMFSKYKYVTVIFVFPTSVLCVGISFLLRLFLTIAYLYLTTFSGMSVIEMVRPERDVSSV